MSGLNKNESYAIAFGMNARGSQEIVLGMLALQAKIIDERIFVGLVAMTMVTILITGPVMKFYLDKDLKLRKESGAQSEAQLIMLQINPMRLQPMSNCYLYTL